MMLRQYPYARSPESAIRPLSLLDYSCAYCSATGLLRGSIRLVLPYDLAANGPDSQGLIRIGVNDLSRLL